MAFPLSSSPSLEHDPPMKLQSTLLTSVILVACAAQAYSTVQSESTDSETQESWTAWRGPDASGVARAGNPPTQWSEEKNIRWKVEVPGLGHATPIVWKDRIYVMTAIETEEEGKPSAEGGGETDSGRGGGRRSGRGSSKAPTKVHEFAVLCLEREDGSEVWRSTVKKAVPHEGGHSTGSQASGSPLTDGEHIWAFFGSRGLYCLDMQGEVVWSKEFGAMRTARQFGEGASPALAGDKLVVVWDHEGDSFIVALDKLSGKELWREERDEGTTWATPRIIPVDGRTQVIVPGTVSSRAYDLENGKLLWSCSGLTRNCIPSPLYADGVVYLMSGYRGSALQAIRLEGAKGDITDGDELLWTHGRKTSYTPSGLLYDGLIYFLSGNTGSLSCVDAASGEVLYEGLRLDGIREVYASPVAVDGRVFVTGRKGVTKVLAHGPKYEELASNELDDGFDASAVIVGDELYLRGTKHLYCIAEEK